MRFVEKCDAFVNFAKYTRHADGGNTGQVLSIVGSRPDALCMSGGDFRPDGIPTSVISEIFGGVSE